MQVSTAKPGVHRHQIRYELDTEFGCQWTRDTQRSEKSRLFALLNTCHYLCKNRHSWGPVRVPPKLTSAQGDKTRKVKERNPD